MNFNTVFLFLLVIAAYLNLYLTFKRSKRQEKTTKLPISSKEWREKLEDENFKSWLSNREKLKGKRKNHQSNKLSILIIGYKRKIKLQVMND